ncbi:KH homology domain-containing protein 4-like [Montipora capricornis]|uniref:KH homology domain-containing protein 4-like n=1 Tax=Montipora capricornis TaxID=246305 RepID=UPI0035F1D2D1
MAASRRRKSKWDVPSTGVDSTAAGNGSSLSATDAAKERAAKLNAMLAAQGKLAKGTHPPAVGHPSPAAKVTALAPPTLENGSKTLNQDLLTAEVEINDSAARTLLCRGTTQDEINRYSGAAVSTRGKFMTEEEKKEAEGTGVKPLYLCIQGLTQEKVDLAVKRIREIMAGVDGNSNLQHAQPVITQPQRMPVPSPMSTPSFNQPSAIFDRQPLPPGMHYVQDKVFVGLDNAIPEFNVKEKLQGPGGSYFQHISTQTGAKVQLRGRGSGFIEPTSGKEAFEALYIYISHGKVDGLAAAKKLVENLIQTVHTECKAFEQTKRQQHYGYSPYMNAVNPPGQPPSGYQPPLYGYPHPPSHGNGYPQTTQHPPGPGYMYSNPSHAVPPPNQPPPAPAHHGPLHVLPRQYRPPPPPVAGYPDQLPPHMPPRGPAPYHGYPPGPRDQGAPRDRRPPPGPYPEGPSQPPPPSFLKPPHVENEPSSKESSQAHSQRGSSHLEEQQPRRKFKEKIPVKGSPSPDQTPSSLRHQESSILNPTLGQEGSQQERERPHRDGMPPPSALPPARLRAKEPEFAAPLPPKDFMPPPMAPIRIRPPGKREAPAVSQEQAAKKKSKTEDNVALKSSSVASLVAYGEDDSSDEEGSTSPEDKQSPSPNRDSSDSQLAGRLPFWAVRR